MKLVFSFIYFRDIGFLDILVLVNCLQSIGEDKLVLTFFVPHRTLKGAITSHDDHQMVPFIIEKKGIMANFYTIFHLKISIIYTDDFEEYS